MFYVQVCLGIVVLGGLTRGSGSVMCKYEGSGRSGRVSVLCFAGVNLHSLMQDTNTRTEMRGLQCFIS